MVKIIYIMFKGCNLLAAVLRRLAAARAVALVVVLLCYLSSVLGCQKQYDTSRGDKFKRQA